MSILVNGMEMPKACVYRENGHLITCPLYDIDGYCGALNTEASHKENGKLSDCPLVHVPPHGRLIDADARVNVQIYNDEFEDYQTVNMSIDDLLDSSWIELEDDPTIIPADPAEEGEA